MMVKKRSGSKAKKDRTVTWILVIAVVIVAIGMLVWNSKVVGQAKFSVQRIQCMDSCSAANQRCGQECRAIGSPDTSFCRAECVMNANACNQNCAYYYR